MIFTTNVAISTGRSSLDDFKRDDGRTNVDTIYMVDFRSSGVAITGKDVGQAAPVTEQRQLSHRPPRVRVRASHSHEPNYKSSSARPCWHR
jgi:hypothetical protein